VEHFFVHFDWQGLPPLALREVFNAPFEAEPSCSDEARAVALDVSATERIDFALMCRVQALVWNALSASLQHLPPAKRERIERGVQDHAPVASALKAIDETPGARFTNRHLARLCCLSEDYFIRRFSECVGQTPSRYAQGRRLDAAAQQLLFSQASIEEIALSCGFANRNAFTRAFTQHTGAAPAAYRRTARV